MCVCADASVSVSVISAHFLRVSVSAGFLPILQILEGVLYVMSLVANTFVQ